MSPAIDPEQLYRVLRTPDVVDPVLLVHFDGWVDAGRGARTAIRHIGNVTEAEKLAEFDTECLLDYRAHRPTLHIVNGINADIDWPVIELSAGSDSDDCDVLILSGAEPDHNWRAFVEAVLGLAKRFGVRRLVSLGAYPAAVPHTRATRLTITSPTPELVRANQSGATLDVPAGMAAAIEAAFTAAGIPSLSLWAQVPHYIAAAPYPSASLALIEGLVDAAGIRIDSGSLSEHALTIRNQLDALIAEDADHSQTIAQLERHHDEFNSGPISTEGTLAISEELGAQFERFLQAQDEAAAGEDTTEEDTVEGDPE
ncbi:MAG: PAC2 family protein [Acidimicrobiaceae bacterium]|nr:PAC2 family protein [Acidimicrobiaceae bacterium]MXW61666.1 PAC2 family protein [Acidimicrobiaceae bacterium]MXW77128.1 PAC2 family protein [Acidimicrobiaceae bacterium]MYA73969.1 PAC2 family protein [Acidimicrobiaceae bacterium]MYC42752.1 PAC2 family protein [Acidimicrobiaceae bacterium]